MTLNRMLFNLNRYIKNGKILREDYNKLEVIILMYKLSKYLDEIMINDKGKLEWREEWKLLRDT